VARETINPFTGFDLRVPESEWDSVRRYTGTFREDSGAKADIDRAPFRRYVDLWWAGLCIGVQEGHRTRPERWHTFETGVRLGSDPWRIFHLELLAIGETGGTEVLANPAEVVNMANEYAATGIPILVDAMTGQSSPIWAASQLLRERAVSIAAPADVE
jgi:hypothetical protein